MSNRGKQQKQLYVCTYCKQGFFYSEVEGKSKICRNCLQNTLKLQKRRTILVCPTCHRYYDSSDIINLDIPREKRPVFELGKLLCSKDKTPLLIRELKEDIQQLNQQLYGKFKHEKESEISAERQFLEKLKQLRSEEDVERDKESVKPVAPIEEGVPAPSEYFSRKSTWPSGEKLNTPHADEFWKYYFIDRQIYDPSNYLGDEKKVLKIKGLLDEINLYLFNPDKLNPGLPVVDHLENGKIFYVGDTHGSIFDLDQCIKFFVSEIEQSLKEGYHVLIVFLGDYVDRHEMDIHNLLYLFSFALQFPQNVRLLRGNHEEVTINMQYGFWSNINRYLPNSYLFNDFEYTFINLPLIHVVRTPEKAVMALHGGIPFYPKEYEIIPKIPRIVDGTVLLKPSFSTVEEMDVLSKQILWGDPEEELPPNVYYLPSRRGVGYSFGKEIFMKFLDINNIDRVVRSHEVFIDGHKEYFDDKMFSIFSSSSYGKRDIDAKILEIDLRRPWVQNWKLYTILTDL
ncbi:MAG: serine/threonine protein phosphatase [Candidatus Lokiarchaeota archaeon]|nr:serine/threonine protein phosphatase [Candidatus Harpocratesius repetitus]